MNKKLKEGDGPEAAGRLSTDHRRLLLTGLLPLEISLERIEEEAIVGDGEPGAEKKESRKREVRGARPVR